MQIIGKNNNGTDTGIWNDIREPLFTYMGQAGVFELDKLFI